MRSVLLPWLIPVRYLSLCSSRGSSGDQTTRTASEEPSGQLVLFKWNRTEKVFLVTICKAGHGCMGAAWLCSSLRAFKHSVSEQASCSKGGFLLEQWLLCAHCVFSLVSLFLLRAVLEVWKKRQFPWVDQVADPRHLHTFSSAGEALADKDWKYLFKIE